MREKINRSKTDQIFIICNHCFWILFLIIIMYPLYLVIISSVSSPDAIIKGEVTLWPVDPSMVGYNAIFGYSQIWRSYLNSIIYTISGTALSLVVTLMAAYAISNSFPGKKLVNFFFIFTMFFSGGLIPTFLTMRDLGLYNNPLMLIISGLVSVWNLMVARTYITTTIPTELYDAARIDGASHFKYFTRVVIPLSGTITAVLCVYYGVGTWNDYFTGLVYIRTRSLLPLQTILREILAVLTIDLSVIAEMLVAGGDPEQMIKAARIAEVVKYCAIIISTVPAVILYLFMQNYFVKGVMIGSIKG